MAKATAKTVARSGKTTATATRRSSKTTAAALARSTSSSVPSGMKALNGSFAPTWDPKEGEELVGTFGEPKTVELQQGRQKVQRRCVEFNTDDGDRFTIWESAGLKVMFDEVEPGTQVFIRYDGLGVAKKGQNPPKLFTVAVED
jgi:hypothetical protein